MTAKKTTLDRSKIPLEVRFTSGAPIVLARAPATSPDVSAAAKDGDGDGDGDDDDQEEVLEMAAYSGGPMDLGYCTMYVDTEGMEHAEDQVIPILRGHDHDRVVAQSHAIEKAKDGGIKIKAALMPTEHAREVKECAAKGFRWQASMGFRVDHEAMQFLDNEEHKASVNGRDVVGPAVIARKSSLKEASVVPLGADGATSATVTAFAEPQRIEARRNKTMSEPTPTPEKKGASLAELKAAFPKDREFALDQYEAGATLPEAKAAFADVLASRLEEAEKKAAAPAPAKPSVRQPVAIAPPAAPAGAPASAVTAAQRYRELVQAEEARLMSVATSDAERRTARARAERTIALEHADVRAALIMEANGGAHWEPMGMPTAAGGITRR